MDDTALISELEPTVERLLERHLAAAKEWFPHEFVPWSRGRDFIADESWDPSGTSLSEAARVALVVNLLTEDNLPYYSASLSTTRRESAWGQWSRQWTA